MNPKRGLCPASSPNFYTSIPSVGRVTRADGLSPPPSPNPVPVGQRCRLVRGARHPGAAEYECGAIGLTGQLPLSASGPPDRTQGRRLRLAGRVPLPLLRPRTLS